MGSFSGCPYLSGSDIGFDVRDNHVSYFYLTMQRPTWYAQKTGGWDCDGHKGPGSKWVYWPSGRNGEGPGDLLQGEQSSILSGFHLPRPQGPNRALVKRRPYTSVLLSIHPRAKHWGKEWLTSNSWNGRGQWTKVALIYNTTSPLPAIRLLWVLLRHALPLFLHQQLPLQRRSCCCPEGRL